MADLDTIKLIPVTVCNRKKNISKSEISLNTSNNSVDILEKSINIKLSYSFFANSKAIVLLPTRLAPSNKQADRSAYFSFHSNNSLYTFRLNIYPPVMKQHYFNITLAEKRHYFNVLFRIKRHYFNILFTTKRHYFNILEINIIISDVSSFKGF